MVRAPSIIRQRRHRLILASALCALVVTGCGSPSSGDPISGLSGGAGEPVPVNLPVDPNLAPPELAPALPAAAAGQDPIVVPAASPNAQPLSDDPTDLGNLSSVTTFADTGLRLGFAGGVTVESIDASTVETYWTHMQTCLNVVAIAPLVIVTDEAIEPLSNSDDVIHYIDGSITATATRYTTGATIQISVHDLDGTLGRIGFNLRSIMGRYLWTSSNLPERDYPHSCASDD